mgnify:CR=1
MASDLQAQAQGQPGPDREADLRQDPKALEAALVSLRPDLLRYVNQRLDRTLKRRLDPEDVVQQALFSIIQRIAEWRANPSYPLRIWVMLQLGQTLDELRRRNLGTQRRDVRREQDLDSLSTPNALASRFAARQTSVAGAAKRAELRQTIERALAELEEPDRRILVLRQFEEVSNEQVAAILGITPQAASKRYQRALGRLRPLLEKHQPDAD